MKYSSSDRKRRKKFFDNWYPMLETIWGLLHTVHISLTPKISHHLVKVQCVTHVLEINILKPWNRCLSAQDYAKQTMSNLRQYVTIYTYI